MTHSEKNVNTPDLSDLPVATRTKAEWALKLAEEGFNILRVEPDAKRPLAGQSWKEERTRDPETILAWLRTDPTINLGANPDDAHCIIDLDRKPDADGVSAFELLELEEGAVQTLTVETPSGGRHLYMRVPHAVSNANDLPSGVDVRGSGGYALVRGCQTEDGEYALHDDRPIADAPHWVFQRLRRAGERDERADDPVHDQDTESAVNWAVEWLQNREPAVEGNEGDLRTYKTACHLRDHGISEAKALELMAQHFNPRCVPPWHEHGLQNSLEAKVRSAYRNAQNRPAWVPHDPEEMFNVASMIQEAAERGAAAEAQDSRDTDEDLFPAYLESDLDRIPDPEWLIRDHLPEESLIMTYGPSGSLKTFLAIDQCLAAATGRPWGASELRNMDGHEVARPLRVVMVAGEGARGIKRRIRAWKKHHGVRGDLQVLVVPVMPRFGMPADVGKLVRTVRAKLGGADLLVVDTVMRAASGLNMNLPADSQMIVDACERLKRDLGCTVDLVHHTGKDEKIGHLGAQNLFAAVDVVRRVETAERRAGQRTIRLRYEKQKDAELPTDLHFDATVEHLGDPFGDEEPETSLVLEPSHRPTKVTGDEAEDTRVELARTIIEEHAGKTALSMNALAEEMARRQSEEELTEGELAKGREVMRNFLRAEATDRLAEFAHKAGKAKNARWIFEDRRTG